MQQRKIRRYVKHGTLPQLIVFDAITRLGSYTRAAEELYMAQPTISVQVKKLTETVGMPLFQHIGKRVHLTEAGRRLHGACQEIFQTLGNVEDTLTDIRGLKSGRLQLAASSTGKYFCTNMLTDFVRQYPGIDIALHVHHRQTLLERFADNADDLYILSNPPEESETVKQMIFPNPMLVYARADHHLAREKKISFERFAQEPFLMREGGSGTRLVTEQAFAARGIKPRVHMEFGNDETIKHAILAGLGVSILSHYALGHDSKHEKLVALDVEGFPLERFWYFAYPVGKQLSLVAQTFMDFVRSTTSNYEWKNPRIRH